MAEICPTVLASDKDDFSKQIDRVSFAPRVQLDFMDGEFAPTKSIDLKDAWWPEQIKADLHLMFQKPADYLDTIIGQKPNLVIIHAEAEVDLADFAQKLRQNGIKAGLCVLPETKISDVAEVLNEYDHLLIFGGNLGYFGGNADLSQAKKAQEAKAINPNIEVGWDGGANDQNAVQLVNDGIEVLNFGGFIQKAEDPETAYKKLVDLVA
jgi:ribulose-phosphate 3-epimerase